MKSLEEFVNRNPNALPAPGTKAPQLSSVPGLLMAAGVPASKAEKFASDALATVSSKQFIHELSETIGIPQPGETKEHFVERCEAAARKLLQTKLP